MDPFRHIEDVALTWLSSRGRVSYGRPLDLEAEQVVSDWILPVTVTTFESVGELGANALVQTPTINLLTNDRPTMMQQWVLTGMSIPVAVYLVPKESTGSNPVVSLTATLRRSGDPVWTSAVRTERGSHYQNLVIAEQFVIPIVLQQGQSLTLDFNYYCFEATTHLNLYVAQYIREVSAALKAEASEGTLQYKAMKLSGVREN